IRRGEQGRESDRSDGILVATREVGDRCQRRRCGRGAPGGTQKGKTGEQRKKAGGEVHGCGRGEIGAQWEADGRAMPGKDGGASSAVPEGPEGRTTSRAAAGSEVAAAASRAPAT